MFNGENCYPGLDGFLWFFGVVEDINDPEQLGRLRVRILGDHTQDKDKIQKEHLPWAIPILPVIDASISGVGNAPVGIQQGTWVIGFYRDGPAKQFPLIFGTFGGIPIDPADPTIGFNDPDECFPHYDKLEEPDTNRLARGEFGKYGAVHKATEARREMPLSGSLGLCGGSIVEPTTPYAAQYPYNKVWEGTYSPDCDGYEWGHIVEWDSTPGSERHLRWHKSSKNFLEIYNDGTQVEHQTGDHYIIDEKNRKIIVNGDWNIHVSGNKKEYIGGNYCLHVGGAYSQYVDLYKNEVIVAYKNQSILGYHSKQVGTFHSETIGTFKLSEIGAGETKTVGISRIKTVGVDDSTTVGGNLAENVTGSILMTATGTVSEISFSDIFHQAPAINHISTGNYSLTVGGAYNETVTGTIINTAASINDIATTITHTGNTYILGSVFASTGVVTFTDHATPPQHIGGGSKYILEVGVI